MLKLPTIILLCIFLCTDSIFCQFNILDKVKKKVEEEIDKSSEEKRDEEEQKESSETEKTEVNQKEEEKTELRSYSKFDFIPGTNLIFYDDFSMDVVGDFPQKWNTNGSGEIVTLNNYPGNWFKLQNAVSYLPYLELNSFGDNFTVEVDFLYDVPEIRNYGTIYFEFYSSDKTDEVPSASSGPYSPGILFDMYAEKNGSTHFNAVGVSADLKRSSPNVTDIKAFKNGEINRLSFSFNKQRFRVYLNEKKVMDLPRILQSGININHLNIRTWYWNTDDDYSILIRDLRIAQGQPDTRNDLITHGKIVTHGILFDSGSDKIKPESYGTLKDISTTLKENSSVRVKVVGHTDSDGSDESNMELSKRRSDAVKNALVNEFGIPDSQLETDGKGESEPVGPNDSPEGKANNRRVEFIKL